MPSHSRPTPLREQAWLAFADRLELVDASSVAERLRRWLDLDAVALDPLFVLQGREQPSLYFFEYSKERKGPTGSVVQVVSACLLRSEHSWCPLSLRAQRKRHTVLEAFEAKSIGGTVVTVPVAPGFGERVTVFARDVEAARALLKPPVREVLTRALVEREASPSLVLSHRHALFSCQEPEPVALEVLELLASDLMSLYAAVTAAADPDDEPILDPATTFVHPLDLDAPES